MALFGGGAGTKTWKAEEGQRVRRQVKNWRFDRVE